MILISRCMCKKKTRIQRTEFNENVEIASKRVLSNNVRCKEGIHAFRNIKIKRGLFYSNQTERLIRYLQFKHLKELDTTQKYCLPNFRFQKLIR